MSQDERRANRNKKYMSYTLVILMIASVAGIYASSQQGDPALKYGDYKFTPKLLDSAGGQYVFTTEYGGQEIYFYYLPQDALSIEVEGNLTSVLQPAQYVVLSTDNNAQFAPLYDLIRYEFANFGNKFMPGGILEENDSVAFPVITCENSSIATPVIELQTKLNETSFVVEDSCVKITTVPQQIGLVRDRLLYSALGIINE